MGRGVRGEIGESSVGGNGGSVGINEQVSDGWTERMQIEVGCEAEVMKEGGKNGRGV